MFDPAPPLPPTQPATLAGTVQALRAKLVPFVDRVGGQIDVTRARLGDVFDKHRQDKQPLSQFLSHAYSVTNDTQIALNVSLNQVGPLMYQVLLPGDTFSRRVPDIYFTLSLRPYTDPSTAYTNFSVAWPILALVGPVAAATSLLAIPFVALAAGGTALASLTGFGAAVVDGTAAAVGIAASSTKTAASLAAKASVVPGGKKVRGKLIDAANSYKEVAQELVRVQVVRYFAKGDAAILPADAAVHRSAARAKRLAEVLVEVDVTGLDMEKVLRCKTGKKTTDANLGLAFKKLVMKFKDWQPKDNPCLRIVGGPELVERGSKTFLVFHPLVLEEIPHLVVEAIPLNELEPTEAETTLLNDAVLAKDMAQAEKLGEKAPVYGNGGEPTWAEEGAKKDGVANKQ